MRDERYKAAHRGGPLSLQRHRLLAVWAADCAEHVLPLWGDLNPDDSRPQQAIEAARAWSRGEISVGEARIAAIEAHAAAREADALVAQYVARAAGHTAGTAHMADHAPGAAMYAIKAVRAATGTQHGDAEAEREHRWQKEQLPEEIQELIFSTFETKYAHLSL